MAIKLIRVNKSDVTTLKNLSRQTFIETFASDNTAENMQYYLDKSFNEEKLTEEINNPNSAFYFAMLDNQPIGHLKLNFGPAQTELKENNGVEVERIYVLKDFQGQKVGQLLFDKAIQIARDRNAEYIWLGVWEKNLKAIAFYTKNGFVQFGAHAFLVGDDEQIDIMMKLVLTPVISPS